MLYWTTEKSTVEQIGRKRAMSSANMEMELPGDTWIAASLILIRDPRLIPVGLLRALEELENRCPQPYH